MTGERKSTKTSATGSVPAFLLFAVASLVLAGCATTSQAPVDATGVVPSERGERELLAEINRKFENPQAHYELGRVYARSGQWSKAEYHYNVALGFDPALRAAQAGVVKLFMDQGRTVCFQLHPPGVEPRARVASSCVGVREA